MSISVYQLDQDELYQVLVNNTLLNTILDKNMQNYTILYTNTILDLEKFKNVLTRTFVRCNMSSILVDDTLVTMIDLNKKIMKGLMCLS